jgi:hypothetical protein
MTEGWRKWFWRSVGFGAGAAVTIAILIGLFLWWRSRPTPPKPWNNSQLTSKFWNATIDDKGDVTFRFQIKNASPDDYDIQNEDDLDVSAQSIDGALIPFGKFGHLETPIFIPGHRSSVVTLNTTMHYRGPSLESVSKDDRDYEILKYLRDTYGKVKAFIILDKTNRLEIDCPTDWDKLVSIADDQRKGASIPKQDSSEDSKRPRQ